MDHMNLLNLKSQIEASSQAHFLLFILFCLVFGFNILFFSLFRSKFGTTSNNTDTTSSASDPLGGVGKFSIFSSKKNDLSEEMPLNRPYQSSTVFVSVNGGKIRKLEIPLDSSKDDIHNMILTAENIDEACIYKRPVIRIQKQDGTILPVSSFLPENTESTAYSVTMELVDDPNVSHSRRASKFSATDKNLDSSDGANLIGDASKLAQELLRLGKSVEHMEKSLSAKVIAFANLKVIHKPNPKLDSEPKCSFSNEILMHLKTPCFNNWTFEDDQLTRLIEHMFFDLGLVDKYKIELKKLKHFIHTVRDNYNNNPFHNFRHAFCVSQMFYGMALESDLKSKVDPIYLLTGLVATVLHDVGHPGFNNAYQVNAKTDLALIYNDQSPLENHHCALGFSILRLPECNILCNLLPKEYDTVRKGIIRCILSTDMAKHAEIMAKFKQCGENFSYSDPEHISMLIVMMVKCSDISNEARPKNVAEPWLDCLLEEYFLQSDKEKEEGLPFAPFMDREKVTKPSAQIGFIEFVMLPMFQALAKVLPNVENSMVAQIKKSLEYYKNLQANVAEKK